LRFLVLVLLLAAGCWLEPSQEQPSKAKGYAPPRMLDQVSKEARRVIRDVDSILTNRDPEQLRTLDQTGRVLRLELSANELLELEASCRRRS
jgi:hypothetical protein